MHLCQLGICYSNFMAVRIIRHGCHWAQADYWQHLRPQPCVSIRESLYPGVCSSIIFYFCLLSWFKLRLSAYSSPVMYHPPPPLPLLFFCSFPPSIQMCCLLHSCFPFLREGALQGWLEPQQRQEEKVHKSLGIYSCWRWDNLSLACYICMDTVPKKVRCMEVIEKEKWWGREGWRQGSIISTEMSGRRWFFSLSRSGGKFIYFHGSYNEILLSTLLWWWEEISGHKFVLPFGCWWWSIYYAVFKDTGCICMIVLFYVMTSLSLCHIIQIWGLRIKLLSENWVWLYS